MEKLELVKVFVNREGFHVVIDPTIDESSSARIVASIIDAFSSLQKRSATDFIAEVTVVYNQVAAALIQVRDYDENASSPSELQ